MMLSCVKTLMTRVKGPLVTLLLLVGHAAAAAEFRQHFTLPEPGNDLVGETHTVTTSAEDTLVDLAERYRLGYNLLRSANPDVDAWLPGEGTPVLLARHAILPDAPREGIVVNVAEMRLYHYGAASKDEEGKVGVYSISVGRGEWSTPITQTRLTGKVKDPVWYPPESIRAEHAARGDVLPRQVPAGPDNPLGQHLLMLGIPSYFIHGTNRKYGIGMQVTHGCIRMFPVDIAELYGNTSNNIPVTIVNQTIKAGWQDGQLYLEIHPALEGSDSAGPPGMTAVVRKLIAATRDFPQTEIDWDKVEMVAAEANGLPIAVGSLPQSLSAND